MLCVSEPMPAICICALKQYFTCNVLAAGMLGLHTVQKPGHTMCYVSQHVSMVAGTSVMASWHHVPP